MKKVGVAILGLGEVGEGTYRLLLQNREFFQKTQNIDLVVEGVLGCDKKHAQALGIPVEKIAANIAEIVCNAEVDIVVETMGGVADARENVMYALNAGKTVVTSNSELVCKYPNELERAAGRHNAGLYFGASCAGGLPVVRMLRDGVQSNAITEVMAVLNGAESDIFGVMAEFGCEYEEAAEAADKIGHGNTDPDGAQAAYQLAILASLAFHTKIPYAKVFRESAANISAEDVFAGEELGYRLKPIAIAKQTAAGIEVRVHPAFVGAVHPLASVGGNGAAVHLAGDSLGGVLLAGGGAKCATGAVVSDIIYAATHTVSKDSAVKNTAAADKDVKFVSDFSGAYYLRVTVADRVGTPAKVASVFSRYNIPVETSILRPSEEGEGATLLLITGETHEAAVKNAVTKISASGTANVESVLRVAL